MIHNNQALQHRINSFLDRKFEELPELTQSTDDLYEQLVHETRAERGIRFPNILFGQPGQIHNSSAARRAHHVGGLRHLTL